MTGEGLDELTRAIFAAVPLREDAVPAGGGAIEEVAHSDGQTYQNFRFSFAVIGRTLYFSLADPQSDVWSAEVVRK